MMSWRDQYEAERDADAKPRHVVQLVASQSSVLDAKGEIQHDHQLYALTDDGSVWWYHFERTGGPYWRRLEPLPGDQRRFEGNHDPRYYRGRLRGPDEEG